jgi:hypothetical protein
MGLDSRGHAMRLAITAAASCCPFILRRLPTLLLVALLATPALAQHTATDPEDADSGTSYALRHSTLWFDRYTPGKFTHAVALADFNKDGKIDALLGSGNGLNERTPVRILMNQGGGVFADQTATRVSNAQPGLVHARKALVGDHNHDGWPDVFLVGHGYDQPPFPGEEPQLFMSNGDGTLRYDNQLQALVGFHHAAASGDVDGNGSVDILVVQQGQPFLLLNDGQGNFSKNTSLLPSELLYKNHYTGEMLDLDRDGALDVVLGGHEFEGAQSVVYWGERGGRFDAARKTVFPEWIGKGIVMDFAADDIDGDGLRDMVLLRTGESPFYSGRALQVLRQVENRQFADETGARITMDGSQGWIDFIRLQDIDGDQDPDLFVDDGHAVFNGQYAWTNDGSGVFAPYAGAIAPAPNIRILPGAVAEGDAGGVWMPMTIRSSQPVVNSVHVSFRTHSGTATVGNDYEGHVSSLQIFPGNSQIVTGFQVFGDTAVEGDESVTMTIGDEYVEGATIAMASAVATIVDDDLATLSISDASVVEGAAGKTTLRFEVQLTAPMNVPVRFDVASAAGSATPGDDFVAVAQAGRTLDAGRTSQVVNVDVLGDASAEGDETFTLTLSNLTGALAGDLVASGTIVSDDAAAAAPVTATASLRAPKPVAGPPAAGRCAEVAAQIAALETRVAAGTLGEAAGIARIAALERRAARCAANDPERRD